MYPDSYVNQSSGFDTTVSFIWLICLVVEIVALWKIFTKAGKPGWASLIPIYNFVIWLQVVGLSGWLVFLMAVPFVNVILMMYTSYRLAKCFGKGLGFALGLIFLSPIFLPILGFSDAKYQLPAEYKK